jgi:ABC-2 type transport system permease protein
MTLARKDFEEIRRQPAVLVPAIAMVVAIALPGFFVLLIVPRATGEALAESEFAEAASRLATQLPALAALSPEAQAQAFVLQQFLMFSLLVPIFSALSLAAQSIVGEKQARALEPLLTTPLSVPELLAGKVLTPLVLSLVLMAGGFLLHLGAMAGFGEPGVWRTMFWPRTLLLYLVVGPLLAVAALLTAAIVSSRVNDARAAQQLGGVLVLPVTALFVAQLAGQFLVGRQALLLAALGLALANAGLLWLGVRVFQRETILMRWK